MDLPREAKTRARRRWIAFIIAAAATVLATVAPFEPWYSIEDHTHNFPVGSTTFDINSTVSFLVGSNYRFLCTTYPTTAPIWGPVCLVTQKQPGGVLQPYPTLNPNPSDEGSSDVGTVYSWVSVTSALSIVASAVAVALLAFDRPRSSASPKFRWAVAVALVAAAALTLGTALGVAGLQPVALAHDERLSGSSEQVAATFWGSCGPSTTPCEAPYGNVSDSRSWGPLLGWYSELSAGVAFLTLAFYSLRWAIELKRVDGPRVATSPPT